MIHFIAFGLQRRRILNRICNRICHENLVLDQDNNFYLISLSILMTCLLDNLWILQGEVFPSSLLGGTGLKCTSMDVLSLMSLEKAAFYLNSQLDCHLFTCLSTFQEIFRQETGQNSQKLKKKFVLSRKTDNQVTKKISIGLSLP